MAADGIVEAVDVTADCARGFDPALEEGAPDEFGLEGLLKNVSTMALSKQFPLPDIEIEITVLSQLSLVLDGAVLAATVRVVNEPGGWTPHGDALARRRRANNASSLWSRSPAAQPTTRRAKRSMTTAR